MSNKFYIKDKSTNEIKYPITNTDNVLGFDEIIKNIIDSIPKIQVVTIDKYSEMKENNELEEDTFYFCYKSSDN